MKNENSTESLNSEPSSQPIYQLLKAVEIYAVQLINSEFIIRIPAEILSPEKVAISVSYDIKAAMKQLKGAAARELFCFVDTSLTGQLSEEDPNFKSLQTGEAILGKCQFVVRYKVSGEDEFAQEIVDVFAKGQGLFQAYPYIRSYVDQQFSHMGVYGMILPLMKVSPPKKG